MFALRSCVVSRTWSLPTATTPTTTTTALTVFMLGGSVRTATKKAGGSTKNGRDSAGRRLGIKVWPGMEVRAGSIIVRQRGQIFRAGDNAGMGRDHTIFAKQPGIVKFTALAHNRKRHLVHILQNA